MLLARWIQAAKRIALRLACLRPGTTSYLAAGLHGVMITGYSTAGLCRVCTALFSAVNASLIRMPIFIGLPGFGYAYCLAVSSAFSWVVAVHCEQWFLGANDCWFSYVVMRIVTVLPRTIQFVLAVDLAVDDLLDDILCWSYLDVFCTRYAPSILFRIYCVFWDSRWRTIICQPCLRFLFYKRIHFLEPLWNGSTLYCGLMVASSHTYRLHSFMKRLCQCRSVKRVNIVRPIIIDGHCIRWSS